MRMTDSQEKHPQPEIFQKKEPFYVCPLDRNMLTLIVMVMMENDCHDYHPLPMLTLLLMEMCIV